VFKYICGASLLIIIGFFTYSKFLKDALLVIGDSFLLMIPSDWEHIYYAGRIDSLEYEYQMQDMWQTIDDVVQLELLGVDDEFEE
jgi:hypothetical protein